jgi:hypothetical protein
MFLLLGNQTRVTHWIVPNVLAFTWQAFFKEMTKAIQTKNNKA